jgi:tetratricopeptide (TPR) repeat protein
MATAPAPGDTTVDRLLAADRAQVTAQPRDVDAWLRLGQRWVRKARDAADPGFYLNAQAAAEVALALAPDHPQAIELQAQVYLNDHRFEDARALLTRLLQREPERPSSLGLLSDALLELGRFDEAATATQAMVDLRPSLPSYSRAAHLLWLQGDVAAAQAAYRLALAMGEPRQDPEPLAWVHVQTAEVARHAGDVPVTQQHFAQALQLVPGYPAALLGQARLELARHRPQEALPLLRQAFARSALPEIAWTLADAQAAMTDPGLDATLQWLQHRGEHTDPRTTAAWLASTKHNLGHALTLAQQERRQRGDVETEDVLAWALYRNGQWLQARAASDRALGLGTKLAKLWFHAGAIRLAQGQSAEGRKLLHDALALEPTLDHGEADEARALLSDVGQR